MTDTPRLGEEDDHPGGERDWLRRQAKLSSIAVAEAFGKCRGPYAKLAARMAECCSRIEVDCFRIGDDEDIQRRVSRCNACHIRLCPLCERSRARKRHKLLCQIAQAWFARRPRDQAVLLTLTTKSISGDSLLDGIDQFMVALRRFTRVRRFKDVIAAWYRTLEITRNAETGLWHVHGHLLLIVSPRYFKRQSGLYITQPEWVALWRKATRLDYDPILDVRALAGVGGGLLKEIGRKSLHEVTKYCTKPSDLVQFDEDGNPYPVDPEILKTLYDALRGRQLVGMSAGLRKLSKQIGLRDDDRDVNTQAEIPDDAVYLGREFYRWHAGLHDYVCVPRTVWSDQQEEHQMPP
jgi:plasmid rolling circle replication initiator protein Rep